MEKITLFESFNISKKKQINEKDYNNIMDLLNELSELDPKCKYLLLIFNVLIFSQILKIILMILICFVNGRYFFSGVA